VVIDFNSNGRFDDQPTIQKVGNMRGEQVYAQPGDMLLIDPNPKKPSTGSPYDITSDSGRVYVSKLVSIDDRFYDMKVSPSGAELSLAPSTVPVGNVTNPNQKFSALIYGDLGFLKLSGTKDKPLAVPEGEWRLLSYTIEHRDVEEPAKPADKEAEKKDAEKKDTDKKGVDKKAADKAAADKLANEWKAAKSRSSVVAATAGGDYKPVKVTKGETVVFPFGPPFTPKVVAYPAGDSKLGKTVRMELAIIGSAGEVCSNLIANGSRPPAPKYVITDPKGEVVKEGRFEYG
jgi:hypothetical protein